MRASTLALVILLLALELGCVGPSRKVVSVGDNYRASQTKFENRLGPVQVPPAYEGPTPAVPAAVQPNEPPTASFGGRSDAFVAENLSLDDAMRVAMVNSDVVRVLSSSTVTAGSTVYDPQSAEANARAALAAFDPYLTSGVFYNRINQPSGELFGPGIPEQTRYDAAGWRAAIVKPMVTGGQASIAYNPPEGYQFYPNGAPGLLNPLHTANLEYSISHPLLRGAGTNLNKAPIRISQIQADQSKWDFKASLLASIRSIADAYWSLYAAHVGLRTIEELVPLLEQVVHLEEERLAAGRSTRANVARARANLHNIRQQRLFAQSSVYERELRLRNLMGLPPNDGRYFVPVSTPPTAPVTFDSETIVSNALAYRPDLVRQRLSIRTREVQLMVAKNAYLPALNATGLFRMNGLGTSQGAAIDQAFDGQFTDYQTGLTLNVPLGRRAATAGIQNAEIQLARERAMMRQMVHATAHSLGDILRQIEFSYRQYQEADARWRDNTEWLEGERFKFENPPVAVDGQDSLSLALNNYLLAMQSQYSAAVDAANLLAQYNTMLVRLEEATGTLAMSFHVALEGDNVLSPRKASLLAADVYRCGIPVNAYQTAIPADAASPVPIPAVAMPGPTTQGFSTPVGVQPTAGVPPPAAPPTTSPAPVAPPTSAPVEQLPPGTREPAAALPDAAMRSHLAPTARLPSPTPPPSVAQPIISPKPEPPRPYEPVMGSRFVN